MCCGCCVDGGDGSGGCVCVFLFDVVSPVMSSGLFVTAVVL